jgi:hypothetical protein
VGIHQAFWFGDTTRNVSVALVGASATTAANGFGSVEIGVVLESHCEYAEIWYGHMLSSGISGVVSRYFTSRPYPIIVAEAFDTSYSAISGRVFSGPLELLDTSLSVVSGTLTTILQTYTAPPELLDVSLSVPSATLTTVLQTYTAPPELLDASLSIASGTLAVVLISYPHWIPDPLDVSLSVISGTLT